MEVHAGRRLGRYVLGRLLGAGGMGEVFEAEDTTLNRRVAIKVLSGPAIDQASIDRFRIEAQAIARISHPNILAIHDFGTADGTPFAVMELLQGRTLRQVLEEGRPDLSTALQYATQMARGLAAAHAKGVAHRDIKPENVFIAGDGLAKIVDFGIAALRNDASQTGRLTDARNTVPLDLASPLLGTAGYLAPEQAKGLPADHRADIFSFGAVLYELITGERAFAGETTIDALHAVLHRDAVPHRVRAGVPPPVERIVTRCLARDPDRRYQSAADLVVDLEDAARSAESLPSAGRGVRLRAWVFAALVVASIAAGWAVFAPRATPAAPFEARDRLLIADIVNQTSDPVFDGTLKQGLEVQLAQSPFLNLVAPTEVADALVLMRRRRDEPITAEIARELCLRTGIKAFITGSIAPLGRSYVIGLQAVAAADGRVITGEQVQADRKEDVLRQLGAATSRLRRTLGESLPSIARFDAPLEHATTASLEALRAYVAGVELSSGGRYPEALAAYRRATEIDGTFALAYQALAREQLNIGFSPLLETAARKAFELRARATESERLRIESFYHLVVTRDLTRAIEIAELWRRTYPARWQPHHALSDLYHSVGRLDEAIAAADEAIRLNPKMGPAYSNKAGALILQNRLPEALAVYAAAGEHGLDAPEFHFYQFWIDLWAGDAAGRARQIHWLDRSTQPHLAVMLRSQAAAFEGRWREAARIAQQAIDLAAQNGRVDAATQLAVFDAPNAAAAGDCVRARSLTARGATSIWPHEQAQVAIARALCGDRKTALATVELLIAQNQDDTLLLGLWAPLARAAALAGDRPHDALNELDRIGARGAVTMWPDLLRGRAWMQIGDYGKAADAFRSLRDNRGRFSWTSPIYPLSHLWLAQAAARAGDRELARREYEALLQLWKHADEDARPVVEARRELARVQKR
jgi:eukaryotic-like serine/threonine-protein kinase